MKLKKIDNKKKLCLAFDGFSASGKSLGAKLLSKKYEVEMIEGHKTNYYINNKDT